MNIQQINYILAVEELKNFGQAARKCYVTQSTLSTMIGRFENEIGIRIFDRKTKPVTLTKEGEVVLERLKAISKEIQMLEEVVQALKGELNGELKIGVIPTVAPFILPNFFNTFARKLPNLTFTISEIITDNITTLILKRELDIGIVAIPLENDDFIEIPLYNEPFVLYDCLSKPSDRPINIDSLNLERFWLLEEGHCLHTQVKKICNLGNHKKNKGVNFDFKAGSIDSLIRFVDAEQGVTLLPYLSTLGFTSKQKKKLHPIQYPVPVRKIGLIVHKHFVKKQVLEMLRLEIKKNILPLFNVDISNQEIVSPI